MSGLPVATHARLMPHDFVQKWQCADQKESAAAREHFLDLCHLLGHPTPAEADPTGASFTFEKLARKLDGRRGFADVWKRGHFAWEYKAKGGDFGKAYRQLLQYRESLDNPPLLVVCDIDRYEIHTNFTGTAKRIHQFANEDLVEVEPRRILRAAFEEPTKLRPDTTAAQVTEKAAARFAALAERLERRGVEARRAAHFLTQIFFCLFAEDIGLLPRRIFRDYVDYAIAEPARFGDLSADLFRAMGHGGHLYIYNIEHFNGGLFSDIDPVRLERDELRVLAEVATLNWSNIEPTVMGTLFERSLNPAKRTQLGAHYTSREDIRQIIEPVLMAPLRREWAEVRAQAAGLVTPPEVVADTEPGRKRQRKMRQGQQSLLADLLRRFKARLAAVRVLDPAAGSGNFLAVALGELLALDKEVVIFGARAGLSGMFPDVSPRQMYGIESNRYAYELAQVSVWITHLQWLTDNGFGTNQRPVLQNLDTFTHMDAVLDLTDPARPREPVWPEAEVIVSNPPYLGGKRLRAELGEKYVDRLFATYDGKVARESDYVCYWIEKARAQIARGAAARAGMLATNSIRGGANRRVLERVKETGDIFMAWADRPWVLGGAAVRISMLGFDNGADTTRTLDGQPVPTINADLTGVLDITAARPLPENRGIAFMGDTKGGPFEIPGILARQWLALPPNPNGRLNSDVIRPWVNGLDLTRRPRDMWIVDFGVDMPEHEAALYEAPFEYVRRHVKSRRAENNRVTYRDRWWLHVEARSGMRKALAPLHRFVCTPRVAVHRLFGWLDSHTLPDSATIAFVRDDDYFFGVLHSRPHELWALRMGTSLEDRPRYTPTTTFETFPFPWSPGSEPPGDPSVGAIAQAARELVEKRDRWLNPPDVSEANLKKRTLTALYNERPTWLDLAHRNLDHVVLDAYGWPYDLSDDAMLARLLALNLKRARAEVPIVRAKLSDSSAAD